MSNVARDLKPRLLPNGLEYCGELAKDEKEQDECIGDLEDLGYLSNQDKRRALKSLRYGVDRIKLARNPCNWVEKVFRVKRCTVREEDY